MAIEKILVVDDELIIRKSIEEMLRTNRFSVSTCGCLADAEKQLARNTFDLILLDIKLPDGEGTDLLERLSRQPVKPLIIMMSGYGTIESAVTCMRGGAFDYLLKPFSLNQVEVLVRKAESYRQVLKVNEYLSQEIVGTRDLLGESTAMKQIKQVIRKVGPTDATVLISGENGTGKELIANEIYKASSRATAPYIKVNCAAVSETLIESEFFGHEKGSFTGATERREGRFELANGGTLLLDEISEVSPRVQAKLLRVLQEREFERVGGTKTIKVDVRVLATTNRDLKKAVENGEFRQDLYYRLNVVPLTSPPLRNREGDIMLLADSMLATACRNYGVKLRGFSPAATEAMVRHDWPGNVRELQNTIERAVILAEENKFIEPACLGLIHVPTHGAAPRILAAPASMETVSASQIEGAVKPLEEVEREHILRALEATNGNRTQAAQLLKISIRTLRNKLNEYKLEALVA
jgi:two-component system, NtrC family, response regulator AtoC